MSIKSLEVEEILTHLTLDEKVSLLSGASYSSSYQLASTNGSAGKDFWHTQSIPRLNLPSLRLSDGPNGVRGTAFFNGVPTACFPCGTALGATWDANLLEAAGELMGDEARAKGVHMILGPTVNMQRSPLGGRGFESFSEDPLLSAKLAAAEIRGIQSKGIAAAIKHFVCNDQEDQRKAVNIIVSNRALREIYLRPFQIALRDSDPWALMTSYNKVNGVHVSEDPTLLQRVLIDEWGYKGLIISDWFGTYSVTESVMAGLDLEMPGPGTWRGFALKQAFRANKVPESVIDNRVRNVLKMIKHAVDSGVPEFASENIGDSTASVLLRELAVSSIVLLKNRRNILPFSKTKTTAVIGPNAKSAIFCGGGSASLRPSYTTTIYEGVGKKVSDVSYAQGLSTYKHLPVLNGRLKTTDGRPGFILSFFTDPSSVKGREPIDQVHLDDTMVSLVDYRHAKIEGYKYYAQLEAIFDPEEDGDYTFGLTVYGTGKLYIDGELLIDNATSQTRGDSFFGAGTREEIGTTKLYAGYKANICVEFGTAPTQSTMALGTTNMGAGGFRLGCERAVDSEIELARAVELAKSVDQVIICVGLNADWESEGFDRHTMDLPGRTDELICRIAAVNPDTAVVIQSGTPVTMPWVSDVSAIAQVWYGGNEAGNATADILFGDANPSGKLPLSFPICNEDNPAFLNSRSERFRTLYGEDVYIGYRFYEKTHRDVLFPFGYGLSYSTFTMDNIQIRESIGAESVLTIEVDVQNQSTIPGHEVVQVYVRQHKPSINRPLKELKGFVKAYIAANSVQTVQVTFTKRDAASFWDEQKDMWVMEKDLYDLLIGPSSDQTSHAGSFQVMETQWWQGH